jgi:NitT/TauT family transport system substrate-binding protein
MKTSKFKKKPMGFIFLLALIFSACSPLATPATTLTPIIVQLLWTHQAEFAGLYAADQNGYYAQEGLAVTFLQGGATIDNVAAVQEGKAQFGIASAEALITARDQGKTLRAIAAVFRRSPTVFLTLANSGITRPQEFAGKTIRTLATLTATLHAMASFVGVSPNQYTEINLPSDVSMFASGDVPIWGMYLNGIAVPIKQAGYKVNIIYPDNYGVHFYGDVLISTDEMIKTNPDLVLRFLRASLKGWTYALENPETAISMLLKVEPKADKVIESEKMVVSLPFINTGEDHIGWMKAEVWSGMEKTLREQGILSQSLDVSQIYDLQFLEEVYK